MKFISVSRNVNGPGLPLWNEYDLTHGHYINLDVNITTGEHLYKDRIDFWLSEIPKIINPPRPAIPATTIDPTGSAPRFAFYDTNIFIIVFVMFVKQL